MADHAGAEGFHATLETSSPPGILSPIGALLMAYCNRCGGHFTAVRKSTGRPRTRCDACRSNQERVDGTVWRRMRAQVLREEPSCCVAGCGMASTEVDHVLPLKLRPDLALVRTNLRGMCKPHNASKGARVATRPTCCHKAASLPAPSRKSPKGTDVGGYCP